MNTISIDEIYDAYRKFKSYVYYDNYSYYLRRLIAEFESSEDFEDRIKNLHQYLNKSSDTTYLEELIKCVSSNAIPKSFSESSQFTNIVNSSSSINSEYNVSSYTYLIEAPVEIHLISVLWVMKVGLHLYTEYNSYAYKLSLKDKQIKEGNKLFRPYYEQYKLWKDSALNTVKKLVDNKSNTILISLDIKDFYHSIDFDFEKLEEHLKHIGKNNYNYLTFMLKIIHTHYSKIINEKSQMNNNNILPIGLLSSGILANWYLRDFDKKVMNKMNPDYYGRYVDDILIVLKRNKHYINKLKEIGEEYFMLYDEIFQKCDNSYIIQDYPTLKIQKEKLKFFIFDRDTSTLLLSRIEKLLRDNSSEFRMLPDETILKGEIEDLIYNISFIKKDNKLRSISEVSIDKYEISKYLSQKILLSKYLDNEYNLLDNVTESIIEMFKGKTGLELFSLWEKLFTLLMLLNKKEQFINLYIGIRKSIYKIRSSNQIDLKIVDHIKSTMLNNLNVALATNLSLNPNFVNDKDIQSKIGRITIDMSKKFRTANMFRHHLITFPLLNYYNLNDTNLLEKNIHKILNKNKLPIKHENNNLVKFSPRYIPFHEVNLYVSYLNMLSPQDTDVLEQTFDTFYYLNYYYRTYNNNEFKEKIRQSTLPNKNTKDTETDTRKDLIINRLNIPNDNNKDDKLTVALANIKVSHKDLENNLLGRTNYSHNRLDNLLKILNMFSLEKCDMIVLPEVSIPLNWLTLLVNYSMKVKKAIIFGMEHVITGGFVYNYQVTILPSTRNGFSSCLIKSRLKNHYSPEEARLIKGYRLKEPTNFTPTYDLFVWKGIHFSCFNCYELTDISHRSIFKSMVDLLVVIEDNRDLNYFSNLAESVSRDLHCFFIQVNNANYGDSRITQPSNTETKNIVQLKGGENSTILIGELNIKELRKFQIKEYELQKEDKTYKPTPPDFNKELVLQRLLN